MNKEYLKKLYNDAKQNERICFDQIDDCVCLTLFKCPDENGRLGVNCNGEWIWQSNLDSWVLSEEKTFLYCIRLLEVPLLQIEKQLQARVGCIINEQDIFNVFPFYEIVSFAFKNSSLYWFELAYAWFEKFSFENKQRLITILKTKACNKMLPQKWRHKISKDISKVNAYFESISGCKYPDFYL